MRQGEPGIGVLDALQRCRTIDARRGELRASRCRDVRSLLSAGRLPPALRLLEDLGLSSAGAACDAERDSGQQRWETDA